MRICTLTRAAGIVVLAFAVVAPVPFLAEEDHPAAGVALAGYCPVAYAAMGKVVKGKEKFAVEYDGKTYYMANGKAKTMFNESPETYAVAYDGWCATGMAHGMKVATAPDQFIVRDGTTYLFANAEAKMMFEKDAAGVISKADANWSKTAHAGHGH